MTGNIIIRPDKFPAGFGQKSREWVAGQLPRAFTILGKMKADIPQKYWMEVPAADKPGYQKLMRESRINLTQRGVYDKRMMKLLWQFRCKQDAKTLNVAYKMRITNNLDKILKIRFKLEDRPYIDYAILNIGSFILKGTAKSEEQSS